MGERLEKMGRPLKSAILMVRIQPDVKRAAEDEAVASNRSLSRLVEDLLIAQLEAEGRLKRERGVPVYVALPK